MTVPSLKQLTYKCLGQPAFYRKLRSVGTCPYDLIEPVLRNMSHQQLLVIEENSPRLAEFTQPLWRMHTLKVFPRIGDSYDIDGDAAEDADWRLAFQEMQEERKEREQIARDRLKANYNQIASGKSERKIQVIKKAAPTRAEVRASAQRTSLGMPIRGGSTSIMSRAVKATMGSLSRTTKAPILTPAAQIRPNPNTRTPRPMASAPVLSPNAMKKSLPSLANGARPSKFLLPSTKRK